MTELCIYHGNCADGFGAAWAVRKRLGNIDFHAGVYQDDPPDVSGRDVILVDFSYKRDVLEKMIDVAKSITIIDHHQTAEEDLRHLLDEGTVEGIFDLTKSGAVLAWEWFHPGEPIPYLLRHIQDRDLWKFELPGTREIQASVFSHPYDFDVWDGLVDSFDQFGDTALMREGEAIERKHFKDIKEFIAAAAARMEIAGHDVPCLNTAYFWSSDAGHIMAQDELFAACYWDTPKGRIFSLRSSEDGMDVAEIAKLYGGGGHKHASGFRVDQEIAGPALPNE